MLTKLRQWRNGWEVKEDERIVVSRGHIWELNSQGAPDSPTGEERIISPIRSGDMGLVAQKIK